RQRTDARPDAAGAVRDDAPGARRDDCPPEGPPGDYVTMGPGDKATYLAGLFRSPSVASTFDQRGMNGNDQAQLAAVMENEGGLNERRRMLGEHYNGAARSLVRKLGAAGRDAGHLDGAETDPKLRLTEDERAVLTAAQHGAFSLASLDSADAG